MSLFSLSMKSKRVSILFAVPFIIASLLLLASCEKEELPSVRTRDVFNIDDVSASVSGDVSDDGGSPVSVRGIVWSTSESPSLEDNYTEEGSGTGIFSGRLTGLEPETTYYVRAYATNSVGTAYGSQVSFTTMEEGYEDPNVISLGPNSFLRLGEPVTSEVELINSVYNEGPSMMNYLTFHALFPEDRVNQEVIDIEFVPAGGETVEDDRGQDNIVYYEFTGVDPGTNHVTYWRARVETREIRYDIDPDDVGTLDDIPSEIAGKYLVDEDIYQINNSIVVNAREDALDGETHPKEMAKKIFHWVQDHMTYSMELGWRDAPSNIETGLGSCTGWAYAFIAMCRSAGLPARWSGALVRRGDQDDPGPHLDQPKHRWAQVYLPKIGWVEANVQGGSWGYLPERYLIISESPGTSNLLGNRYDAFRRWSFDNGGDTERERYGMWWPEGTGSTPDVPVLTEPEDGEQDVPTSRSLKWEEDDYATSYRVQVSTCEDFSTIQYYNPDVEENSHSPRFTSKSGETYYWRVSASSLGGTSDWSQVYSFTR